MASEKKPWDTSLSDLVDEGLGFDGGMHFVLHLPVDIDDLWKSASFWPKTRTEYGQGS
jgi:hypothetical protein